MLAYSLPEGEYRVMTGVHGHGPSFSSYRPKMYKKSQNLMFLTLRVSARRVAMMVDLDLFGVIRSVWVSGGKI